MYTNNMYKEITKSVIAVLIVLGAIATIFVEPTEVGTKVVRFAAFAVIGYYFNKASRQQLISAFRK